MEELLKEMEDMIVAVNINEIADHLNDESLFNWCGTWRESARQILEDMRQLVKGK